MKIIHAITLCLFVTITICLKAENISVEEFIQQNPRYKDSNVTITQADNGDVVSVYSKNDVLVARVPYQGKSVHGIAYVRYNDGSSTYQLFDYNQLIAVMTFSKDSILCHISLRPYAKTWSTDESGSAYFAFDEMGVPK